MTDFSYKIHLRLSCLTSVSNFKILEVFLEISSRNIYWEEMFMNKYRNDKHEKTHSFFVLFFVNNTSWFIHRLIQHLRYKLYKFLGNH